MTVRLCLNDTSSQTSRTSTLRLVLGAFAVGVVLTVMPACDRNMDKPALTAAKNDAIPAEEPLLTKAVVKDDQAGIKARLEAGDDVDAKDALGRTPLHMAAFYGNLKASEVLIGNGANINAKDRIGMTPLHAATISGGRQEVQLLLDKKADIGAKTDAGQTALHLAAATGQPKLSRLLIERGANPQERDKDNKTPLSYAQQNSHPQTTALLQQYQSKN